MSAILFVGGTRSGKSALAQTWAEAQGTVRIYIATATPCDDEMQTRIEQHQMLRGHGWKTHEASVCVWDSPPDMMHADVVLFDCATLWLSNCMAQEQDASAVYAHMERLVQWIQHVPVPIAIVSSELGQGMVPMQALARRYRDAHGLLNQKLAKICDTVLMVSCGLPQALKGRIPASLHD